MVDTWLTQSFCGKPVVNTRISDGRYLVNWLTQSFSGKPVVNTIGCLENINESHYVQ